MSQKALTLYEASEAEVTLKHLLSVTDVLTVSRLKAGSIEGARAVWTGISTISCLIGREEALYIMCNSPLCLYEA